MKLSFQKHRGDPSLGILFYWRLVIDANDGLMISDNFIPDLFYDYFYIQQGQVACLDVETGDAVDLPQQWVKTVHTRRITFQFCAPVVILGARFTLRFADRYKGRLPACSFLAADWLSKPIADLATFELALNRVMQQRLDKRETAVSLLTSSLQESDWLASYSPRHRRRLIKNTYGVSKKEMQAIQSIHAFLAQSCDFSSKNPHIIDYLNDDHFYDQPHLNHAFKKMTGLSLLDYFEVNTILQDNFTAVSYNET